MLRFERYKQRDFRFNSLVDHNRVLKSLMENKAYSYAECVLRRGFVYRCRKARPKKG